MKLSKLFFLFSILLLVASCGDDDGAGPMNGDETFVGIWDAVSFNADVNSTTVVAGQSIVSESSFEGQNMNYVLTFQDTDWTTMGNYDLQTRVSSGGVVVSDQVVSYNNIEGQGTYSTTPTEITVDGSLFTLSVNGMNVGDTGGPSTAAYTFNGPDEFSINQNETMTSTTNGVTTTSIVMSTSVWRRQ